MRILATTTSTPLEFYILNRKKKGRLEGEVTQILKRSKSEYVGVIQLNKNFAFVVPDDKKMPVDIYVPLKKIKNAKEGQKVLVKIVEWPSKAECPTGKVVEVLGDAGFVLVWYMVCPMRFKIFSETILISLSILIFVTSLTGLG